MLTSSALRPSRVPLPLQLVVGHLPLPPRKVQHHRKLRNPM